MIEPTARGAGEVSVVRAEQFLSAGVVLGLHQPTPIAHLHPQRVMQLRVAQVVGLQIGGGGGRKAKVHKSVFYGRTAVSAFHSAIPVKSASSSGWDRSRADRSCGGNGQVMASRGSSWRSPPSEGGW